ncbi:retinol dehydrogenase 12 [Galendromus occidentalis]|uniref:Retinol dehydrogenase 12 n=1 Tax=Galendromus occidentalis TaxID=34638 RepID=A0AAJ7L7N2_9ACAR|nr:retinol dehydrogenase 12 [Galendromus occidentalis]
MDCFSSLLFLILQIIVVVFLIVKAYIVLTIGKCKSTERLDGKVVIVTGANSGIGKETSRELLNRGARVILACRNSWRAVETASEFRDANPDAGVSVKQLDLCDLTSVRTFAAEILREEEKIDILINNAGTIGDTYKLTADGYEEIYQSNYLGPFLLTELLLPVLKKSAPSRIINTGSLAYAGGRIDPSSFESELSKDFLSAGSRYCDSKLAMLMWTRAMAVELRNSGVTINVVHPGVVWTSFAGGMVTFGNLVARIFLFLFGRSAVSGAQTILHLCLDPAGETENGQYWAECRKMRTWGGNDSEMNEKIVDITRQVLYNKKGQ